MRAPMSKKGASQGVGEPRLEVLEGFLLPLAPPKSRTKAALESLDFTLLVPIVFPCYGVSWLWLIGF